MTRKSYAKRRNCIWRATQNPFSITVVGKFVNGGCPTSVFGTASPAVDGDEDGSPTIHETRVENPSLGEGFIPRAMGRNKARKLKEKGKTKDDIAFQQEMTTSLRLMTEQNAIDAEEMNHRHEQRAKQIQEEMDDKNMPILIGKRGKLWPDDSCLPPTILLQWQMMMIIDFKFKL
ncbi:hypothetical protein D8674_029766 [Pyrus ussuriensis x Pyrus communis]|uniref:No apical meristem-associated C-terminal domain-containing protein n=1 Tax=Pyrus ussuriensis x Pyrus communis TaxID=2448454 RepID=A0A5N5I115_9ROSA|nr:hypothetical protein D8674_029766 [Pyrus ussuriensis x Pyrus communis]